MTNNSYKEVNPKSWTELRNHLLQKNDNWIFRGLEKYRYNLKTTLERYLEDHEKISFSDAILYEREMLSQFKRSIHLYIDNTTSIADSDFQKICFLQHYSAPTRLLDFSFSPFVACFFALRGMKKDEKENEEDDGAVFAIDCQIFKEIQKKSFDSLRTKAEETINKFPQLNSTGIWISNKCVDDLIRISHEKYFKLSNNESFIGLVSPYYKFGRLTNQDGCFLIQFNIKTPFEQNFKHCIKQSNLKKGKIIKYRIKSTWRDEALRDLNRMNINNSTLFPGLDGYVQSLNIQSDLSLQIQKERGDFS